MRPNVRSALVLQQAVGRGARLGCLLVMMMAAVFWPAGATQAAPGDAEIKQMVERGLKYLEKNEDDRLGGRCLIGLAFHKAGRKSTHPRIVEALQACQAVARGNLAELDNYSVGLGIIFLLEIDPEKNVPLAKSFVAEMLKRQKPHGGWGYDNTETGDTSQTQYPTLALWLAINCGVEVPLGSIERDIAWLLRTQDPSGAWGYQGNDPGKYERVEQNEIRPALAAAGLGSVYICADLLGLYDPRQEKKDSDLPTAFKPTSAEPKKKKTVSSRIDPAIVKKAIQDGNHWFSRNYTMYSEGFTHYYLYAFERYQSFRDYMEGRQDDRPKWYNDVATELARTQKQDGSWDSGDNPAVSTSFAILTLLRSAKQTIEVVAPRLGEGVLLGGMGLPKKIADLQEKDGRVVEEVLAGSIEELVTTLEKSTPLELERMAEASASFKLDSDVTKRSGEIVKLKSLVASGPVEARLVTVKALARVRDLDNVPLLIHAMSDSDVRIVREADRGLRFISRKIEGVGLSDEPKPGEINSAIEKWKEWYLSIRPTGELLD